MQQVMLGWRPRVDLSAIKDSLTCYIANWSFAQEEDNGLRLAYKALSRHAWSSQAAGLAKHGRWDTAQCVKYLEHTNRLSNELFAAIHITSGLPA